MGLAKTVVHRPTTVIIIFALVIGLAIYMVPSIPIDLYPEINPPVVVVVSNMAGAGPEEMEETVTRPLETALINVSNMKKLNSTSSEGNSLVMLEFDWGYDLVEAMNETRDKLEFVRDLLPEGASSPSIFKFDPTALPIMELVVKGERPPEELSEIATKSIQPFLEQVEGVASTSVSGGREKIVAVEIPRNRLEAYGLTLTGVANALSSQNIDVGAGSIGQSEFNYQIVTTGEFKSLDDIRDAVVGYAGGGGFGGAGGASSIVVPIRVRDIGSVEESYRSNASYSQVYINGKPGVYISVMKQSGTNSVSVSSKVKERLDRINIGLPAGVSLELLSDSTVIIRDSLSQMTNFAVIGAALAMFVLFFFLRSVKSTMIVGLSLPVSLLITLMVMYLSGLTLNIFTVGGLILGLGMIVDSSIVVLENIFRYREKGAKLKPSAVIGSSEMLTAITASTLTTVCVFLPVLMFRRELGFLGVFFKDIALTVVIALLSSLFVSLALVPVLSSSYLKLYTRKQKPIRFRLFRWLDETLERGLVALDNGYRRLLGFILNYRGWTITIILLILLSSALTIQKVGINLFPDSESSEVNLEVSLPIGSNLASTEKVMAELEEIIQDEIQGIDELIVTSGTSQFFGLGGEVANEGSIKIVLPPLGERIENSTEMKEKLRLHFDKFPSVSFSFTQGDEGGGQTYPIDLAISSEDLPKAKVVGETIQALITENLTDVVEPSLDVRDGLPRINVSINKERAYDLGLNSYTVGNEISASVSGKVATRYRTAGGDAYDVVVILPEEDRDSISELGSIFVPNTTGRRIPVSNVAVLERATGPVTINREDQARTIHVTASLKPGVPASEGERQVRDLLRERLVTDDDVKVSFSGDYAELMSLLQKFIAIVIIAVVLVFGVMASQFESLKDPFIIFLSIPLMIVGIVLIYSIVGVPFSIMTAVGVVMLAGIVVNNGIVLVDYTNLLRKRGLGVREACIEAGGNRLRPILMTSLTTILGMVPLAFMGEDGSSMVRPIGLTVVGGMSVSTIMTLFMVPVVYSLFNKEKKLGTD